MCDYEYVRDYDDATIIAFTVVWCTFIIGLSVLMKRRSLSLHTRSVLLSRSQQKLDFLITIFLLLCSKIFINGPFSTLSALALEFVLIDETFIEFKKVELSVKSFSCKSSPIFISEEISLKSEKMSSGISGELCVSYISKFSPLSSSLESCSTFNFFKNCGWLIESSNIDMPKNCIDFSNRVSPSDEYPKTVIPSSAAKSFITFRLAMTSKCVNLLSVPKIAIQNGGALSESESVCAYPSTNGSTNPIILLLRASYSIFSVIRVASSLIRVASSLTQMHNVEYSSLSALKFISGSVEGLIDFTK
ncbi:hypothetical protein AGLY_016927 [Aphis glycines]|uniref:Uncharacterized protein n=1 Tax=Aphis glycines TaxID=307491 RepID=A0A6G0SXG8_APHGL|nr:hypothetical protein AGLY_016927 [Aphis glycines]